MPPRPARLARAERAREENERMKAVEASAKTREEAIQKALQELGVEMYEVDKIEIVDEGSKGFLGFGARPVRVRLIVEKLHEEPRRREERGRGERGGTGGERGGRGGRDRDRGGRDRKDRESGRGEPAAKADRPARPERGERKEPGERKESGERRERSERPERRERAERPERKDRGERKEATADAEAGNRPEGDAGERGDKPRRRRGGRGGRGRRGGEGGGANGAQRPADTPDMTDEEALELQAAANVPLPKDDAEVEAIRAAEEAVNAPLTDEQGQEGAAHLQGIIDRMGIAATVTFGRGEDGGARLTVESGDGALLIGRKGRNLSAMQYLVNRMISRGDTAENTERLVVDVEGYVDRRRQALEELARDQAAKAKEGRRTIRLKPMSPWERRIIHLVLQNDEDVRTYSLGESLYRSVVIAAKNAEPDRVVVRGGGSRGGEREDRGERGERGGRGGRGGRDRDRDRPERRPRAERPARAEREDDDFENDGTPAASGVVRPKGLPKHIAPVVPIKRSAAVEAAPEVHADPEDGGEVVTRDPDVAPEPQPDGPRGARSRRTRRGGDFDAGALSD